MLFLKKYLTVQLTMFEIVNILLKPKKEQPKRNHRRRAQKTRLISLCNCTVMYIRVQ
jgi:hypothetical protein